MSGGLADALGLVGSALMVGAFAYSNLAQEMRLLAFNLLNLVGSLLMIFSLWVHFNLAAMILEITWAAIALFGTVSALRRRA